MECCLFYLIFQHLSDMSQMHEKISSGKRQQGQVLVSPGEFLLLLSMSCLKYSVILCFQAKCRAWWMAGAAVSSSVQRLSTCSWQGLSVQSPWWHSTCTQKHRASSLCLRICPCFPSSQRASAASPAPCPAKCPMPVCTEVTSPTGQLSSGRGTRGRGSEWNVSTRAMPSSGSTCPRSTWRNGSAKWRPCVLPSNTSGTCSLCCALTLCCQEKLSWSQTRRLKPLATKPSFWRPPKVTRAMQRHPGWVLCSWRVCSGPSQQQIVAHVSTSPHTQEPHLNMRETAGAISAQWPSLIHENQNVLLNLSPS